MRHLVTALALFAAAACSSEPVSSPRPDTPTDAGRMLVGTVLLDGAVNGCGGEQVTVQVRESGEMVGSQLVDSSGTGADCVFKFQVPVPRLRCYELLIDRQPVGRYPASSALRGSRYNVGVIDSSSVYGNPMTGKGPRLYADFNGC